MPLVTLSDCGLYCPLGDFHIDPWRPVPRAIVTHAHGDHLAGGCEGYLVAAQTAPLARVRLSREAGVEGVPYGERRVINGVAVSFHPAGHILGSAQIRLEHLGQVCVISGDYKTDPDLTCTPFEPVRCHHFITESTFGLPIYRWPPQSSVFAAINAWWRTNADAGVVSMLYGYALGKAQRLLSGLDASIGPILTHGAVDRMTQLYREAGIALPPTEYALIARRDPSWRRALVLAPPSAADSTWARRFGEQTSAFASGWMQIRGARRRRGVERGFTLSDHVDWPALLTAVEATGCERLWVTHGFTDPVVRWFGDRGLDAAAIATRWEGERNDTPATTGTDDA
jgi:putative mRNA 3-end processing factor